MPAPIEMGHYREATDRGMLCDKVGVCDPAAAPDYTDAEASAQPTSGEASLAALGEQRDIARRLGRSGLAPFAALPQPGEHGNSDGRLAAAVATLVGLGVAAAVLGLLGA